MSEEHHHHHHLFGRHKEDDQPPPPPPASDEYGYSDDTVSYQQTEYYDGPPRPDATTVETTDVYVQSTGDGGAYEKAVKEEKWSGRKEHMGEMGAAAAGAFAMYERHEAKKDPEHAGRHKMEERIAEGVAVGAGGYAFHEHHEKKEAVEAEEASEGHKKHHHFF